MAPRSTSYTLVTGMIALSLLAGGPAAAAAAASSASEGTAVSTASTAFFADVKSGHWAEKSIVKLALQGIILGDKGNFKPAANVSHQEAVVMALRFMGKDKEAEAQPAVAFPESFKVSNYFKPYVAYALKMGLLDEALEFKAAEASKKEEWGSAAASREWLTKLIVRVVDKGSLADELASNGSTFQDASSISSGYTGYINAAVSLGLITGVTPQQFQPAGAVTRASAAVMFGRAQTFSPITYAGESNGILTAVSGSVATIYTETGPQTINLASDARFYRFDSEISLKSASELKLYTHVRILGGSEALYVEQTDADPQVTVIEGSVSRLVAAQNKLWLWTGDDMKEIQYDSSLLIKRMDGTALSPTDLSVDSQVQVIQDTFRSKPMALEVIVKSAPVSKEGKGTVTAAGSGSLSIKTAEGGQETWSPSKSITVVGWDGRVIEAGLAGIKIGDSISYTVKDSELVSVKVASTGSSTVQGKYSNISEGILTYLVGSSLQSSYLSDAVTLVIPGVEQPVLGDLYKEDQLDLTMDGSGKVTGITVTNRSLSTLTGAEILSYTSDKKVLTVKGTNGRLEALQLSDKTKFDMNGTALTLEAAASMLRQGLRVTVGYSGGDAMLVRFVYQYTGSIVLLNTATKTLAMSLDDGTSVTLPFDSMSVEWFGHTAPGLAEVKTGMRVTAVLDSGQSKATILRVNQNVQYKITTVDPAAKVLSLQATDGSMTSVATGNLTLKGTDGASTAFSSFAAGQTVNVTYAGTIPTSVTQVKVTYGKISAVAADSVTLQEFGGSSVTIALGTGFSIVKNGSASASALVLAAGDRVEVKKNADGAVAINVNSGVTKTFWKLEADGQLLTKKLNLNDNDYRYAVTSATLVTAGGQPAALESLKDGDTIVLFLFGGKLLEVAKG